MFWVCWNDKVSSFTNVILPQYGDPHWGWVWQDIKYCILPLPRAAACSDIWLKFKTHSSYKISYSYKRRTFFIVASWIERNMQCLLSFILPSNWERSGSWFVKWSAVTARVRCKCSKSVTLNTATYSPPKTIGDSLGITVACLSVNVIPWALWYVDPWASSKGNCFLKYRTGDLRIQSSSCKFGAYCVVHITFAIELFLHSSLHLRSFMEVLLDHLEATPCCDPST